jgi:hypothetical protein
MTKKVKIFIGVASAIGVVSAYYFLIYRKRKPNLDFSEYNWDKRYADVKFGNTTNRITEFKGITFTAGSGYDETIYSVTTTPLGKGKVSIVINKNGEPIEAKEIDFDSRLIVDK